MAVEIRAATGQEETACCTHVQASLLASSESESFSSTSAGTGGGREDAALLPAWLADAAILAAGTPAPGCLVSSAARGGVSSGAERALAAAGANAGAKAAREKGLPVWQAGSGGASLPEVGGACCALARGGLEAKAGLSAFTTAAGDHSASFRPSAVVLAVCSRCSEPSGGGSEETTHALEA